MADSTHRPPGTVKRRSSFNNWISASGAVLAIGALFSFALLVWMDFTQGDNNPYLGILTFIVAPIFLISGLVAVFGGAFLQRRYAIKHAQAQPDRWQIDFGNPRHLRIFALFGVGAVAFLLISAFGSYRTYHFSESNAFCGQVCHTAMNPEFVTYQRGAHARVDCVDCHIGSGAEFFFKSKINGTHQLFAYLANSYERPISTPLKNLRPAQDTCEKCHWPEKVHGNIDITFDHYLSDKKNTPYSVRMLMLVNTGRPGGPLGGIHWHVNPENKVEYYATDPKRQDIPWMRVTDTKTGAVQVFRTEEFTGEPPANLIRRMDCIDCHNRPAHTFPAANDSVERAMASGAISTALPNIKRVAVQAMTQPEITGDAQAPQKIAEFLRAKYPETPELTATIAEVQKIHATSIFIDRQADWRAYPDNLGHKNWNGCFRCHGEKHKTDTGRTVRASDCNSCHTIIAQGAGVSLSQLNGGGLEFKHPDGELDPSLSCVDCHNGGNQGK